MRILYVCRLYSGFKESLEKGEWAPKGAPTIARVIEHLDQSEHELSIVLVPKGQDQVHDVKTYHPAGLATPINVISGRDQLPSWLWKFRDKLTELVQLCDIYRAYKEIKPDIVYCDRVNIFPAAILSRFTRANVIWRVMGILEDMHKAAEANDWRARYLKWLWRSPFERVICTLDGSGGGPWMKRNINPITPQHLLLNGVKKGMQPEHVAQMPLHGTRMLFVGRLEGLKGIEEFLDAFYALADEQPELHAVIAGDGSLKSSLEEEAARKGLAERVHFLGALSPAALKYVRQNADFYVSLNKQANLSNVNLEALSDSLPTVIPASKPKYGVDIDTDHMIPADVFYRFGRIGDKGALLDAMRFMCSAENRQAFRENAEKCKDDILPTWEQRIQKEISIFEGCVKKSAYDDAIVISDLGSGGAQKVATALASDLVAQGRRVLFITLCDGQDDFFTLPDTVTRIALNQRHDSKNVAVSIAANIKRICALRNAIKRYNPDRVISFIAPTNILTIAATRGLGVKTVISERNDPARQSFGRIWDLLRRAVYPYADIVSANSSNALQSMRGYVPEDKLVLTPNALPPPDAEYVRSFSEKENAILIVGRLHPQKQHAVLIDAFAKVEVMHPDWSLIIVGDGSLRGELEAQAKRRGVFDKVSFVGVSDNPYQHYASAKIFVLPSLHEGTPNALLEAMSCGLAPVVSEACEGALPYIEGGKSGFVVPVQDAEALADALSKLIEEPGLCQAMAAAAREKVAPLSGKTTYDLWRDVV